MTRQKRAALSRKHRELRKIIRNSRCCYVEARMPRLLARVGAETARDLCQVMGIDLTVALRSATVNEVKRWAAHRGGNPAIFHPGELIPSWVVCGVRRPLPR